MMGTDSPGIVWPTLRQELAVFQGPNGADGSLTWSLHDPARNLFFKLDWATFEILARWHLGDPRTIVSNLAKETTLRINAEAVAQVANFLIQNELVQRLSSHSVAVLGSMHHQRQTGWVTWVLHHYLFFRIPLWRPDSWLNSTLPHMYWLFGQQLRWATLIALFFGLYEIGQQWEIFTTTLVDFFSWTGVLAYAVTLIFVKTLHELGHAFTAKRFGCKVPVMGVAFLVMLPVAYTDVNDAWKLSDKRQRMAIDAAGIVTELVVAVWSSLIWAFLPEGVVRHGFFLLCTTTWISTVLINASPFMRFDGYFLLMDYLEMPNLHQRAFSLARWHLREILFSLDHPLPELFSPNRQKFLLTFAYVTWLYRLVVFSGIAYLVYSTTPWLFGLILGSIEVAWFLGLPIWREFKYLFEIRDEILIRPRSKWFWRSILLLFIILFLPWDPRITAPALLRPENSQTLMAPRAAMIGNMVVGHGSKVKVGDLLVRLTYPDLAYQQQAADARLSGVSYKAENAGIEAKLHENQLVLEAARGKAQAEVNGISREMGRFELTSPIVGVAYWTDPDWHSGMWLRSNTPILEIADVDSWQVYAYMSEKDLKCVSVGDFAKFFAESGIFGGVSLRVTRIDEDATRILTDGVLSTLHGGEILVREKSGQLTPDQAIYRVTLSAVGDLSELKETALTSLGFPVLRGRVVIYGKTQTKATSYLHSAFSVLMREWNL